MVEKVKLITEKVKYAGLGNFKSAYQFAYEWLKNEGYSTIEKSYTEKVSGGSKEIEVEWESSKELSDYFKSSLKVKWKILGMSDVEVEVDGKREKMNKFVELQIEASGTLEKDYNSKWETSPFNKFIRGIYNKYIIHERVNENENSVKDVVQKFKEEMKAFLDLTGRK